MGTRRSRTDLLRGQVHILLRHTKAILHLLPHLLSLVPHTSTVVDSNRMAATMVEEGSIITATTSDSAPDSMTTRAVTTTTTITRSRAALLQLRRRTIRSLMPPRLERRRSERPIPSVLRPATSPRTTLTRKPSSASLSAARFPSMFSLQSMANDLRTNWPAQTLRYCCVDRRTQAQLPYSEPCQGQVGHK